MTNQQQQQDATRQLLTLLCTEIARDGGVGSLVMDLKDYNSRITNKLLSKTKTKKLLSFLEQHPDIFVVDRQSVPHVVRLVSREQEQEQQQEYVEPYDDAAQEALERLIVRVWTVLRKQQARRQKRQRHDNTTTHSSQTDNTNQQRSLCNHEDSVNSYWLAQQCTTRLHAWLRACGWYVTHTPTTTAIVKGSVPWHALVLPPFQQVVLGTAMKDHLMLCKDGTVVTLCKKCIDRTTMDDGLEEDTVDHHHDNDNKQALYLQQLGTLLAQSVQADRSQHLSYKLLLHRYPQLHQCLAGRHLPSLVESHPQYFFPIHMITDKRGEIYFCCSKKQQQRLSNINDDTSGGGGHRMKVDEVGLFSVAGSKWRSAMVNRLVLASRCFSLVHNNNNTDSPKNPATAIDLTASIGGFTLELAKRFASVIAIEIDPTRAELCAQNMRDKAIRNVEVRNKDCMDEIAHLPRSSSSVVLMDPPWGGVYYKNEKTPVTMGRHSLEQVLREVARYLSPVVVGIRLPVNFDAETWLTTVAQNGLDFQVSTLRKFGPQLFAVLVLLLPSDC